MTRDEILEYLKEKLEEVVVDTSQLDSLTEDTNLKDDLSLESSDMYGLLGDIEDEKDISFDDLSDEELSYKVSDIIDNISTLLSK